MSAKMTQLEIKIRGQVIALENNQFSFAIFLESNSMFQYLEKPRPVFGDSASARIAMKDECKFIHKVMKGEA